MTEHATRFSIKKWPEGERPRERLIQYGADIVERQKTAKWGSGFLKQLSTDLIAEFPDIKGFSHRNIKYIRQWYLFYSEGILNCATGCVATGQQLAAQLADSSGSPIAKQATSQLDFQQNGSQAMTKLVQIPWWHNVVIITKFLLELGAGFAFVRRQKILPVSDRDFFIDLLFYHTKLYCYVVIELEAEFSADEIEGGEK